MPDISKINNVAVADISKLDSITFADGQKVNNQSVSLVTDAHTFIADNSSDTSNLTDITFSSGIDSTYDVYEFEFVNVKSYHDYVTFQFQVNATDGADYNDSAITTAHFTAYHDEPSEGTFTTVSYSATLDAAESTSDVALTHYMNAADADKAISGKMTLYAPSSGTYVKHFISRISNAKIDPAASDSHMAGYIDDTTAIDDIRFRMSSGNMDGLIRMYGIKKS